jgi:hypothetical protein
MTIWLGAGVALDIAASVAATVENGDADGGGESGAAGEQPATVARVTVSAPRSLPDANMLPPCRSVGTSTGRSGRC